MTISSKRVAITGAARGIGFEVVRKFLSDGYRVALIDVQEELLETSTSALIEEGIEPERLLPLATDVSDEASVINAFSKIDVAFGGLDSLVNAAAINHVNLISETTAEAFSRVLQVNQLGVFLMMKHAAPLLKREGNGTIVNFASLVARSPHESLSAYCSSKAGVISLTQVAALELSPEIRVNAVSPGIVDTEMQLQEYDVIAEQTGQTPEEVRQEWVDATPLRRLQVPSEIADLVFFLSKEDSRSITGQSVGINGGLRMD